MPHKNPQPAAETELFDLRYEKTYVGCLLLDTKIAVTLPVEAFYDLKHRLIYQAILNLKADGIPPDLITVTGRLRETGTLKLAGGPAVIADLTTEVPSAANHAFYATAILRLYQLRQNIQIAEELSSKSRHALADPGHLAQWAVEALTLHSGPALQSRLPTFDDYFETCRNFEEDAHFRPDLFGGIQFPTGTVSFIGARTTRGKTSAMVNLARETIAAGRKTLFISLEMSQKDIFNKLILSTAYGIALRDGFPPERESPVTDHYRLVREIPLGGTDAQIFCDYWTQAIKLVREASTGGTFIFFDGRGAEHAEIINTISAKADRDTLILLDYIQAMPPVPDGAKDSFMRVGDINRAIMNATVRTDAITIAGAQINRTGATRGRADALALELLRESGNIEQDAENVIGLGWEADEKTRFIEILKYRQGQIGMQWTLDFNQAFSYMERAGERVKPVQASKQKAEPKPEEIIDESKIVKDWWVLT
ncbi:replicative DNA helicase [Spirochaetia bacterium]|nr:replicative DNA helicase [Spirochaetia bacterium]